MSTESVTPSNHLILCLPLLLLPSLFLDIRVFSYESALGIRWPKYWSFSISPSDEYLGLISFRLNWFDLAVQGTLFFFNFILFLKFTILYWFCQISKWICHRYTCVPHPEPSSLLPPHTIPLGRPSAPAPSIQYRASNLDWRLVSYMIVSMFQCHSPKSSHPLPLPQSP